MLHHRYDAPIVNGYYTLLNLLSRAWQVFVNGGPAKIASCFDQGPAYITKERKASALERVPTESNHFSSGVPVPRT